MTRFHTKRSADKTLHKLKEVLDKLKYSFTVNSPRQVKRYTLTPLNPNISMHILHTVLNTILEVLTEEFFQQPRASLVSDDFL